MTPTPTSGAADLRTAAQAVVDRWDTPLWKDVPATAEYIGRLRAALAAGQATAAQADSQPAIRQLDTDEVHGAAQNLYWGKQPLQDAFERGAHWGYRRGVSAAKEAAGRARLQSKSITSADL